MDIPIHIDPLTLGLITVALMGAILCIALLLMGLVLWQVRRIDIPPDADFMTALLATPLMVVVVLDLLDFALDFLSAPVSWVLLTRLGLGPLRGVTVVEGLIPGTQLIPTMTLAWIFARLTRHRRLPGAR